MKNVALVIAAAVLAIGLVAEVSGASSSSKDIADFDTLGPVSGPFVGTANPIRDVSGGGLPWQIAEARGSLGSDGSVKVEVQGLVLLDGAPVPTELQGTNPVPAFKVIVSCLTVGDGTVETSDVSTDPFPATPTGDARIKAKLALPSPCLAPILFVTSPTGGWFAVTGSAAG